jgi:hypothetical protein
MLDTPNTSQTTKTHAFGAYMLHIGDKGQLGPFPVHLHTHYNLCFLTPENNPTANLLWPSAKMWELMQMQQTGKWAAFSKRGLLGVS